MIPLEDFGLLDCPDMPDGLIPARIIEEQRGQYRAVTDGGEVDAVLSGAFYHQTAHSGGYPAVGDFVLLRQNPAGRATIAQLLPRRSKFARADLSGHAAGYVKTIHEQVVAANFDYVFILSSLNRDFKVKRILRYLTQARPSGGTPVVVLTKADLCESFETRLEEVRLAAPDVDMFAVSSVTGFGFDRVAPYIAPGKTIVFLGMSGVGKSSLLNALAGESLMHVAAIREDDARGRHTTTHRQLLRLPSGAMIIDTPGMRELGLIDADEGIGLQFADIEALIAACRFGDCKHGTEPGCAVRKALETGGLPPDRWEQYLDQRREARFVEARRMTSQERRQAGKAFSKMIRSRNKESW